MKDYLKLHGIASTERLIDAGSKRIGQVCWTPPSEGGADLLVVGGYGRGRLRESIIGGITRHVIAHAGIAIFMVH